MLARIHHRFIGASVFIVRGMLCCIAAGLVACAGGTAPLRAPSEGGPEWSTLESPHFVMHTDLPDARAREALGEFESRYAMLLAAIIPGQRPPPTTTRIVAFRNRIELEAFVPESAGVYRPPLLGSDDMPVIVVGGEPGAYAMQVWQHEVTHRLVDDALGDVPMWLEEGMAGYYSTATIEEGALVLGRPPLDFGFTQNDDRQVELARGVRRMLVPIHQSPTPSKLMTLRYADFQAPRGLTAANVDATWTVGANYAASWAFVHLLVNGPPEYNEAFAAALQDVAKGADSVQAALLARLPPTEQVDKQFFQHLYRYETKLWKTPFELPPAPAITVEPMRDADVLLLWAKLGLGSDADSTARRRLGEALQADPEHPEALYVRGALACRDADLVGCARDLRAAADRAPDEPGYWAGLLAIYESTKGLADREATLDRSRTRLAALARSARDHWVLASSLAMRREFERAEPLARKAVTLDPNCWQAFEILARIEFEQGEFPKAVALQRQAINRAPAHGSDTHARLTRTLVEYEQRLAG